MTDAIGGAGAVDATGMPGRLGLSKRTALQLRSLIFQGTYKAGEALPPEAALAKQFGVSRDTVRAAVSELVAELLVERRRGIGTFVRDRGALPSHGLERLVGVNEAIRSLGMVPSASDVALDHARSSAELADPYGIPAETPLARLQRTILADGRPVLRVVDWVPEAVLPDPRALAGFAPSDSLSQSLASFGIRLGSAMSWVLPILAGEDIAELLQVEAGTPLLQLRQIHYDAVPPYRPVLYSDQRWNSAAFQLHILRRA